MNISSYKFDKFEGRIECYDGMPTKRIMIVDDEASILKSAERCLSYGNYDITSFQSPREALKSAHHYAYDLIISDQRMPCMSGTELLIEISAIQPQCVGVILSGFSDSSTLLEAINQAHIYQFVCKPWVNSDLKHIVEKALDYGEQLAETQRLADRARVNSGAMTKHRAQLRELEARYPGITQVERDENGAIILTPNRRKRAE
ncbi:MAG TPA: response regulator [Marinagarivorans sp.]